MRFKANASTLVGLSTEGPQFSTRAESNLYRSWGGTIINMSTLPEAKLAAEAEIAYQVIIMSTDYDVSGHCVKFQQPTDIVIPFPSVQIPPAPVIPLIFHSLSQ